MGSTDSLPVVSQVKSLVQVIGGDAKGAKETQENFSKQCIVVSQVRSLVEVIGGDKKAARQTQLEYVKGASQAIDGIPIVGHIKGGIHYACKDKEGGDNAMKSASRSVGVIGGGVAGFFVAGPVGAAVGGIAGGGVVDGITTGVDSAIHGEYRPAGQVAAVTNMVEGKARIGDYFDSAVGLAMDGVAGYAAGKLAGKIQSEHSTVRVYRVAETSEVTKAVETQKISKGFQQSAVQGETWVSESIKHSQDYIQQKNGQGLKFECLKAKVKKPFFEKLRTKDTIRQNGAKAVNKALIEQGQNIKNVMNTEKLANHSKGKINIGIKGDANLATFNDNVVSVKKVNPLSWKRKNGVTKALSRYGKETAGMQARELEFAKE